MPSIPFNPFPQKTIIIPDDAYIDILIKEMFSHGAPSTSHFFKLVDPKNNTAKFYNVYLFEHPHPYFLAEYGRIGKPAKKFDSRDKDKNMNFNEVWNLFQKKCIEKINKGYIESDSSAQYDIA